jgi:hypothetical protein
MKPIHKIIAGIIFTLVCLGSIIYYQIHPLTPTITMNGTLFTIELAVTNKEIEKGLGGRTRLEPKHGMLFLRDHKERYSFWMGGMQFPLDFVWLDGNRVVDITKNVPVETDGNITQLKPNVPVDKILELNAGEVDKAGIKIGDTALFNK